MPGASKNILLVGVGALSSELARELAARGSTVREASLSQLESLLGPPALLVLGPAAARSARLDVVRPYQADDRPIIVLSEDSGAADQLRFLTSARVVHVPPRGTAVQVATAIVRAAEPEGWEATETVRPPPAALPPEVMAEMTGSSPRSEPPELDPSLLESVRPGAPPPPPAPPAFPAPAVEPAPAPASAPAEVAPPAASPLPAAEPASPAAAPTADWPEPEPAQAKKRSVAPLVAVGVGCIGLLGIAGAVAAFVMLGGSDEVDAEPIARPAQPVLPPPPIEPTTPEPPAEAVEEPEAPAAEEEQPPSGSAAGTPDEVLASARAAEGPRDPRQSDNLVLQAERSLSGGDLGMAEELLRRALSLDPDNPRAWAALGRVTLARGDATAAVRWLELAVDRRGRRAEYHLWLGDARRAAGDEQGARQAWQSALRRDPDNREAQQRLR